MSKASLYTSSTGNSTTIYIQRPIDGIAYQLNPDGSAASFVTLTSNRFTLAAGTYRISIKAKATGAAADNVGIHLYNFTDSVVVPNTEDAQQVAIANENVCMFIETGFTIASSKAFDLRGRGSAAATNGFGIQIAGFSGNLAFIDIIKTN